MQHHGAILRNVEGCARSDRRGFRLGRRGLPVLPARSATPMSIPAGSSSRSGSARRSIIPKGSKSSPRNIEEVRPTIMVVVPRLFEVLRTRILKQVEKQGRLRQLSDGPRAGDRRQGLCGHGAACATGRWTCSSTARLRPKIAPALRRPDQGDGLGRRAAQSRGRHLLPFARPDPAAGLRPDRVRRR